MSADGYSLDRVATAAPVGHVLKWTLLAVAVVTFALLGLATKQTYRGAPPIPAQIAGPDGAALIFATDIWPARQASRRPTSWTTAAAS